MDLRGRRARDEVLRVLAGGVERSQAALAREAGVSTAAVSGAVADLLASGAVTRRTAVVDGRRCHLVKARRSDRLVAGVDIGRTHLRVVVGTSVNDVVDECLVELPPGHRPAATLAKVRRAVGDLSRTVRGPSGGLACVGVGVPGPVDRDTSSVVSGTILPGWVGVEIPGLLSGVADEVVVENDANLGALACHALTGVRDLLYVKLGTGIGAGILVRGRLVLGRSGLAGELGHVPVPGAAGAMCRCGRRGCLETVASLEAVAAALSAVSDRRVRTADVLGLGGSASPLVRRVLDDAGEALGRAVGAVCSLVDPGAVVIGGQVWPGLLGAVRAGFTATALPAVAASTDVGLSRLDDRAEVLGALHLACSRVDPLRRLDAPHGS